MAAVGTVEVIATIDTSNYKRGASEIERTNSNLEGNTQKTSSKMNGAFSGVAKVGIAALVAATVAAGAAIIKNIGGAIERIDTLVAFPRVLQALGVSSDEAESATEKLAESLRGLPTALGAGAKGVQGFVTSGLDVDKATRAFLGFNNAMLAASVETGAAQSSMQQLNQALSRGRIDGQEWNSIAANIPTVLQALQNETGKSKDELRELFREDPQALLDNIIRLNEKGGGGLASLEKQARDATGGIGTAFANFDNAVQRGIQSIVTSIGGGDLEAGQKKISDFISNVAKVFGDGLEYVGKFVRFLIDNKDVVLPIIVAVTTFVGVVTALATAITLVSTAMKIFNLVLASNPIGLLVTAIAALVVGLIYFFTQTKMGKKIVSTVFEFISKVVSSLIKTISDIASSIGEFFQSVAENIMDTWNGIVSFFQGIWNGIISVFNNVINFFKEWGLTILAVAFFPISLIVGYIIQEWEPIKGFFQGIWNFIVGVFSPVISFFVGLFQTSYTIITTIWSGITSFYASVFKAAWSAITTIWNGAVAFFSSIYNSIVSIYSSVSRFFSGVFSSAWNGIKAIFSPVGSFFRGVWNTIVGIFGRVGTSVGNAIAGTFKSIINTIISRAVNMINGFVDAINGAVDIINNIPGVNIGKIGRLGIPQLATGGIVTSATLALIGEGSEPEAVIPLSKLDKMINGDGSGGGGGTEYNIGTINIASEVDGERWLRRLSGNQEIVSNGLVPTQSYM